MKFYDHLASTYDIFIHWEERIKREEKFYQHLMHETLGTALLDLGCGTGGFSIYCAEMGYNVVGIDSSPEMIAMAKQNADANDVDIDFECLQMTDFSKRIDQSFDLIFCMGNTLSHILEAEKLKRMFTEVARSIKPGGIAIFHALNYHRILENKRRDFPAKSRIVNDKEYVFIRFYNYLRDLLEFNMVVAIKENGVWSSKSHQMLHFPWRHEALKEYAKEAGFHQIMLYGDFQFSDYDPDESENLLMVCELGDELEDLQ